VLHTSKFFEKMNELTKIRAEIRRNLSKSGTDVKKIMMIRSETVINRLFVDGVLASSKFIVTCLQKEEILKLPCLPVMSLAFHVPVL